MSQCQKDFDVEKSNPLPDATSAIMTLAYEVETLTVPALQNPETATPQKKIQAMMFSERSKVEMTLYHDGTSSWQMEKLAPKHNLQQQHLTPPGTEAKTKITRIDRNGMGSFYDEKEILLYQHAIPVPSFAQVVANLKENPNAIFTAMGIDTKTNVNQILTQAKANGFTVQDLGEGLVSIRMGVGGNETTAARQKGINDNYTIVNIFNTNLGIMMGSTLYNEQQEMISQAFYSYELNDQERLMPQSCYLQVWDVDPITKEKTKTDTHTSFENVSVTLNPF